MIENKSIYDFEKFISRFSYRFILKFQTFFAELRQFNDLTHCFKSIFIFISNINVLLKPVTKIIFSK